MDCFEQGQLDITPEEEKRFIVSAWAEVTTEWWAATLASILTRCGMHVEVREAGGEGEEE